MKKLQQLLRLVLLICYLEHSLNMTTVKIKEYHASNSTLSKSIPSHINIYYRKPYLVAMSMIENLSFDDRCAITGKSFDSHVLIMNFSDAHIITLNYVLETPIEVSTIEFHPENPNVIIGGTISG